MGERERSLRCSEGRRPGRRRGRAGTRREVRGGPACGTVLGAQHAGRCAPPPQSRSGRQFPGLEELGKRWDLAPSTPGGLAPKSGLPPDPPPRNRSLQPEAK